MKNILSVNVVFHKMPKYVIKYQQPDNKNIIVIANIFKINFTSYSYVIFIMTQTFVVSA